MLAVLIILDKDWRIVFAVIAIMFAGHFLSGWIARRIRR
jgi:hypothetical protein